MENILINDEVDLMRLLSYSIGVTAGGYLMYNILCPYPLGILVDAITIVLCAISNNNSK